MKDDLTTDRDNLQSKLTELENSLENLSNKNQALTASNELLTNEKAEVMSQFESLVKEFTESAAQLERYQEEVNILTETHVNTLEKKDIIAQKLIDLEPELTKLQGDKTGLESEISGLKTQIEEIKNEHNEQFEVKREATETLLATRKAEFQHLKDVKNEKIQALNVKLREATVRLLLNHLIYRLIPTYPY